jgi:diguanylate cyclase (GGDEF)-like protein
VPVLDTFTLLVVTTANLIMAGLAMVLVARLRTGARGIGRCAASCALFVLNMVFVPVRLASPGPLGILLTNLPLFAGAMCLLDGIVAFRERARPLWLYVVLAAGYLPAFNWFLFAHDNFTARVVVHCLFLGTVMLIAAGVMYVDVPRTDRGVYWSTAAGFALYGLATLARAWVAVYQGPLVYLGPSIIDLIGVATLNISTLSCAFGLSMATNLRLQRRTEQLALYDPLTRLPNRRFFEEKLELTQRKAIETGQRIALIYCDLDDFKEINDTLGHEAGDQALQIVAERLRGMVSSDVLVARIGGDEFVLLIENAWSRQGAQEIVRRLRVGASKELELAGRRVRLQISCGLAVFPEDVGSVSDLLRLADAGMYAMKQQGRNTAA